MLPLLGNVNWEAAEVLVSLQHAWHKNWSVWLQCSRNHNQKERLQVWQEEIRDVPQSWRRNLLFPHYINNFHRFPLLLDVLVVCCSLALSSHLQTFLVPAPHSLLTRWLSHSDNSVPLVTPGNANGILNSFMSLSRRRNIYETERNKGGKKYVRGKKNNKLIYFYSTFSLNIPATVVPERPASLEIVIVGHV